MDFELSTEVPTKSVGELKNEFYKVTTLPRRSMYKKYRDKELLRILKPIAFVLNPIGYYNPNSYADSEVYIAVYPRKFFVRIEQGNSVFGPHKFELRYQVKRGVQVWLGTCIKKFPFYNKKDCKRILRKILLKEQFFCSEQSAAELVELIDEHDTEIKVR